MSSPAQPGMNLINENKDSLSNEMKLAEQWLLARHEQRQYYRLDERRSCAEALGLFPVNCPVVIVTGTNGKGTCCLQTAALAEISGYHVGCYTSPHLLHLTERIQIDGVPISEEIFLAELNQLIQDTKKLKKNNLSYFDYLTFLAIRIFQKSSLDLIILEVGIGGREDTVNLFDSDLAVITNVDLDHQALLGKTREEIAWQKAGIMRSGKPTLCADVDPPAALARYATEIGAELRFCSDSELLKKIHSFLRLDLPNLQTPIPEKIFSMRPAGRQQWMSPNILVDVAHNPASCRHLARYLRSFGNDVLWQGVIMMRRDKDLLGSLKALKEDVADWIPLESSHESFYSVEEIAEAVYEVTGKPALPGQNMNQLFEHIGVSTSQLDSSHQKLQRWVIFGSFVTVQEALKFSALHPEHDVLALGLKQEV